MIQPRQAELQKDIALIVISDEFKRDILEGYTKNSWPNIMTLLSRISKRSASSKGESLPGTDFQLLDGLIYMIRDGKSRLCIPQNCEQRIFQVAHDQNSHAGHHRTYERLMKSVFIPRLSRKLHLYIRHCPPCQLHQTKRHLPYDELMSIPSPDTPMRRLAMDFIVALPGPLNSVLTVTCKTSRRITIIPGK